MPIGVNFHAPTLPNPEGLRRLDLRWALFLADPEEGWNSTTHLYAWVLSLCPRCQPIVRLYRPDVMGESPKLRAEQFCAILTAQFGDEPVDAIPGNEFDQAIEHGGQNYDKSTGYGWVTPEGLGLIASWLSRYADAHRAIRPQDILHLPACSAGMDVADWYAAMKAGGAMQKYDVLDVHLYASWQLSRLWDTQAIGKTFISEVGVQNGTIEAIIYLIQSLSHADFAWWKWNDKDDNPEGDPAGYAIADRPDVIDALAEGGREAGVNDLTPPDYVPEVTGTNSTVTDAVSTDSTIQEEDKVGLSDAERQELLAMIDYAWGKAEQLYGGRMKKAEREKLAFEIQRQLVDMKLRWVIPEIQEGGSAPAPFLGG